MPMNMMLDYEGATEEIEEWKRIARSRRQRSASVETEVIQKSGNYFLSVAVTFRPIQHDVF